MKTLIFSGSPRKEGDTVCLINKVIENLNGEYKIINAYDCWIHPCIDCRYCWEYKGCCVNDEMQGVCEHIQECDNVLIASPIYFSELTGALLNVGSRLQTYFCARFFRKARIFPNADDKEPNRAGLEYYHNVFKECKKFHIEPLVTIYHNDIPLMLTMRYHDPVNGGRRKNENDRVRIMC